MRDILLNKFKCLLLPNPARDRLLSVNDKTHRNDVLRHIHITVEPEAKRILDKLHLKTGMTREQITSRLFYQFGVAFRFSLGMNTQPGSGRGKGGK